MVLNISIIAIISIINILIFSIYGYLSIKLLKKKNKEEQDTKAEKVIKALKVIFVILIGIILGYSIYKASIYTGNKLIDTSKWNSIYVPKSDYISKYERKDITKIEKENGKFEVDKNEFNTEDEADNFIKYVKENKGLQIKNKNEMSFLIVKSQMEDIYLKIKERLEDTKTGEKVLTVDIIKEKDGSYIKLGDEINIKEDKALKDLKVGEIVSLNTLNKKADEYKFAYTYDYIFRIILMLIGLVVIFKGAGLKIQWNKNKSIFEMYEEYIKDNTINDEDIENNARVNSMINSQIGMINSINTMNHLNNIHK